MTQRPILSIVTPTLGMYSESWLEAMSQLKGISIGEIEHVLVYPPGASFGKINAPHIREICCTEKGGTLQRYSGLLNARGQYVLCIDDDDYLHPEILDTVKAYFSRFSESWLLRLRKDLVPTDNPAAFTAPWTPIPDVQTLEVNTSFANDQYGGLLINPIVPFKHHFKLKYLVFPFRKTGIFTENFNNMVWKNEYVQAALPKISEVMTLCGPIKWHPASGCERFFGLFVQAYHFNSRLPNLVIGHVLPQVPQVRFATVNPVYKKARFHVFVDLLLLIAFPKYDYFWSRAAAQIYDTPRTILKLLRWKFSPPQISHKKP